MQVTTVVATMTVVDFDEAVGWYERLLGAVCDAQPMPGLAEWHVAGGVVQVLADEQRAGSALLSLGVEDISAARSELEGRGLALGEATVGVESTIAVIGDPAGNTVTLAQPHAGG